MKNPRNKTATCQLWRIGRNGVTDHTMGVTYWAEWMHICCNMLVYLCREPGDLTSAQFFSAETSIFLGEAFQLAPVAGIDQSAKRPITPAPGRLGFFEITYTPGKTGVPGSGLAVFCLEARGFAAAAADFDALNLGTYRSAREISEEMYQEWYEMHLADIVGGLYD